MSQQEKNSIVFHAFHMHHDPSFYTAQFRKGMKIKGRITRENPKKIQVHQGWGCHLPTIQFPENS